MREFIAEWFIMYWLIIFAMCVDNIFWIPDSREFKSIRKNFFMFIFLGREWALPKNIRFTFNWFKNYSKKILVGLLNMLSI